MAHQKLNLNHLFGQVTECRHSGLSDRQWCINNGVNPSTFYYWVKLLRNTPSFCIPESEAKIESIECNNVQDIVRLNIADKNIPQTRSRQTAVISAEPAHSQAPIELCINGIRIQIHNSADPALIANTLKALKLLC